MRWKATTLGNDREGRIVRAASTKMMWIGGSFVNSQNRRHYSQWPASVTAESKDLHQGDLSPIVKRFGAGHDEVGECQHEPVIGHMETSAGTNRDNRVVLAAAEGDGHIGRTVKHKIAQECVVAGQVTADSQIPDSRRLKSGIIEGNADSHSAARDPGAGGVRPEFVARCEDCLPTERF